MRLLFVGDILCSNMQVVGTAKIDYENVLIDTGAFKTGIPFTDCQYYGLRFAGTHNTSGLFGDGELPLFRCDIVFDDGDTHTDLTILGLPINYPIIGRDILSKYEFGIDWPHRAATATRLI